MSAVKKHIAGFPMHISPTGYTAQRATFIFFCHKTYPIIWEIYHKVASKSTCYYSENQFFGGVTNQDMSLNETCFCLRLYSRNPWKQAHGRTSLIFWDFQVSDKSICGILSSLQLKQFMCLFTLQFIVVPRSDGNFKLLCFFHTFHSSAVLICLFIYLVLKHS